MDEFKLKRKTDAEHICIYCGKAYTLKKCLEKHENTHHVKKLNNKKVKVIKPKKKCSLCNYTSDRNSSIKR